MTEYSLLERRVERLERLLEKIINASNPWEHFAGIWKNDPTFNDFLAAISEHRQDIDDAVRRS